MLPVNVNILPKHSDIHNYNTGNYNNLIAPKLEVIVKNLMMIYKLSSITSVSWTTHWKTLKHIATYLLPQFFNTIQSNLLSESIQISISK